MLHKNFGVFSDQPLKVAVGTNARAVVNASLLFEVASSGDSVGPIISNIVKLVRRHLYLFLGFGGELVAAKGTGVAEA